jgi:hypothetical protein
MSGCCECCVLSGRGLCDGLVTRPEESYRLWCVWVWSWSVEKWGGLGPQGAVERLEKNIYICTVYVYLYVCMYVCMCVYLYVCMHMYTWMYTCVCRYVCMYVCMYVYLYVYICMYVRM